MRRQWPSKTASPGSLLPEFSIRREQPCARTEGRYHPLPMGLEEFACQPAFPAHLTGRSSHGSSGYVAAEDAKSLLQRNVVLGSELAEIMSACRHAIRFRRIAVPIPLRSFSHGTGCTTIRSLPAMNSVSPSGVIVISTVESLKRDEPLLIPGSGTTVGAPISGKRSFGVAGLAVRS